MLVNYFKFRKISLLISSILFSSVSLSANVITLTNNQIEKLESSITINSTSYDALGVEVDLLEKNSQLINNTTIKSTILSTDNIYSSGIYFDSHGGSIGMKDNSKLINEKDIIVQSTGNNEVFSDAININYLGNNSNVINNGYTSATSIGKKYVDAVGIALNSLNNDSSIVNNGIIKATAQAPILGKAIGILISGIDDEDYYDCTTGESCMNENSLILNNGTVEVSTITKTGESVGIAHYGEMIDESKITNSSTGIIKIISEYGKEGTGLPNENFAQSFGITVDSMKNKSSIINEGIILADSKNISIETKNYNSGIITGSMYNETSIVNKGKIEAKINGKLDYRASSIFNYYSENSTIVNEKEGQLSGNIVLLGDKNTRDNGDITLNNKGFISLPYDANKNAIILNDDENRVDSMRPYIANLINSGTIEIGAFKDFSGNIENTQILTKNATFETGSKMQVAVVSGSKAFILGDILSEVVKSTNKLTINELKLNQTKLLDNSALLDFELKYDEVKKQIDLVVAKINTLREIEQIDGKKYSYNATQVDIASRKSRNDKLLAKLQTVDSADYENALESLVPTTQLSAINVSNQISSNISNIVSSRLSDIKNGLNSGNDMKIDNDRVWIKASGSFAKQKNEDSILGYDLKGYSLGIGYDKEYKDNQFIGFGTFYTNANIETNQVNHVNDIDAYSIIGYGSNLLKDDKTTVYYQVAHSWQKNNNKREVFTGEVANSEFTSKNLSADLKVGHKVNLSEKVSIEPKIGLEYKYYNSPVVIEKGASNSNVRTDKFNSSEVIGNVGAEIEYKINKNSRFITSLKGGYDLKNDKNKILTSSFVDSQDVLFNSKSINNGRLKYEAGIGYEINLNERNTFNIFYKHLGEGNKYTNDVITLNYNYEF